MSRVLCTKAERTAAETLRPLLGHANAAGVGGDDGDVVEMALETVTDVIDQHWHGHQMIDRAVEEASDCAACRSTDMMRSAPAVFSRSNTRRQEMGSRPRCFLS